MTLNDFVAERGRLISIAHRILGSVHDAEDAVQTAWLHVQAASDRGVDNAPAWLTTVVTRVCLDQLRDRRRRDILARRAESVPDVELSADEEILVREDVSRALMVLLDRLTAPQRVAFVLHDLFAVPFDHIAAILGTTPANAKKHASRARGRVRPDQTAVAPGDDAQHQKVRLGLHGRRRGRRHRAHGRVDGTRLRAGGRRHPGSRRHPDTGVRAAAVAEETRNFVDRIRSSAPMRVNGRTARVIAPGGHALAVVDVDTHAGVVTGIAIRPVAATDVLEAAVDQACGKCDL